MAVFLDSRMKRTNTDCKQTAKFVNANAFESPNIVDFTAIIQFLYHTAYKRSCQPQTVYFVRAKLSLPGNSGVIWGVGGFRVAQRANEWRNADELSPGESEECAHNSVSFEILP